MKLELKISVMVLRLLNLILYRLRKSNESTNPMNQNESESEIGKMLKTLEEHTFKPPPPTGSGEVSDGMISESAIRGAKILHDKFGGYGPHSIERPALKAKAKIVQLAINAELQFLRQQLADLNGTVKTLNESRDYWRREFATKEQQLADSQKRVGELENLFKACRDELDCRVSALNTTRQELSTLRRSHIEANQELSSDKAECEHRLRLVSKSHGELVEALRKLMRHFGQGLDPEAEEPDWHRDAREVIDYTNAHSLPTDNTLAELERQNELMKGHIQEARNYLYNFRDMLALRFGASSEVYGKVNDFLAKLLDLKMYSAQPTDNTLEELGRDGEILDWIEANEVCINQLRAGPDAIKWFWHIYWQSKTSSFCHHFGSEETALLTLRQSLNAAMQPTNKPSL